MNIKNLVRPNILSLAPYSTARDEFEGEMDSYLDANESPYDNGCNRYPDPHQKLLKKRICELKNIPIGNLFLGNGSDEAIDLIFRLFCTPSHDTALAITPSYGMYRVAALTNDVELQEVTLCDDFTLDATALLGQVTPRTKVVFLCSPNNPSGNLLDPQQVIQIIENFEGIVVVDEAYIDYSDSEGFVPLLDRYENLIVLQTLSKSWGMAALRVGMAISSEFIVSLMSKIKYPYNINALAQAKALEMLSAENVREHNRQIEETILERERVTARLSNSAVVKEIYPSAANFILVRVSDALSLYNRLIDNRIIVRNRSSIILCGNTLRITIGTPPENDNLIKILENE
ncbi:MAG: histidinol-phosphate transaminase [Rikenellaceae bacterium]